MRLKLGSVLAVLTVVALVVAGSGRTPSAAQADSGPALTSIGPLTFGPDGTLFAADTQAATIYALDLGRLASGGAPGAKSIDAIDQKIAGILGTEPREIAVTDLVVHPKTRNAYISVMRGQGAAAKPALLRVDGTGKLDLVAFDGMKYTKVTLPNPPSATEGSAQSAAAVGHRHGIRRRQALRRRAVERGVRLEAPFDFVSVCRGRQRHQRRNLPRQPRAVRNAFAGVHVRARTRSTTSSI